LRAIGGRRIAQGLCHRGGNEERPHNGFPYCRRQATGSSGSGAAASPQVIKVSKPQGDQAQVIKLDGTVTLDLSAVANEKITLVHVGNTLIILFDNQSTISKTLTGWTGGQTHAVFTLTLNGDGTYAFTLLEPLTTPAAPPSPSTFHRSSRLWISTAIPSRLRATSRSPSPTTSRRSRRLPPTTTNPRRDRRSSAWSRSPG